MIRQAKRTWSLRSQQIHERSAQAIEDRSLEFRARTERAYAKNPKETDAELVHLGFWLIAAQLRIDYAAGRLS